MPVKKVLVLFIVISLLEILLLIKIGQKFGWGTTFLLVAGLGVAGVILIKKQGLYVLHQIRTEISRGYLPGDAIIDGLLFLCGGLLLVIPGVLTAAAGLMLMVPWIRRLVREVLKGWLINQLQLRRWHFEYRGW